MCSRYGLPVGLFCLMSFFLAACCERNVKKASKRPAKPTYQVPLCEYNTSAEPHRFVDRYCRSVWHKKAIARLLRPTTAVLSYWREKKNAIRGCFKRTKKMSAYHLTYERKLKLSCPREAIFFLPSICLLTFCQHMICTRKSACF